MEQLIVWQSCDYYIQKEYIMEKKTILFAGILTVEGLLAATLFYWWLAPDVASKTIVYLFLGGTLIVQGVGTGVLWHYVGTSKAMPVIVCGSVFVLGILVAGCLVLVLDAPARIALYFLGIFCVLYAICVGYLSYGAAETLWNVGEDSIVELPSIRHSLRDWMKAMKAAFTRRQPGETEAQRQVRSHHDVHSDTHPHTPAGPPPLPRREG